jgi:hypothetical protein
MKALVMLLTVLNIEYLTIYLGTSSESSRPYPGRLRSCEIFLTRDFKIIATYVGTTEKDTWSFTK